MLNRITKLAIFQFFIISMIVSCCFGELTDTIGKDYELPISVGMTKKEILESYGKYELLNRVTKKIEIVGTQYPPGTLAIDTAEGMILSNQKKVLFHKDKFIIILLLRNKTYEILLAGPCKEKVYGVKLGDSKKTVEGYFGKPYQTLKGINNISEDGKIEFKGEWLYFKEDNQIVTFYINNDDIVEVIKLSLPLGNVKKMLNKYYKKDIICIREQLPFGSKKGKDKESSPKEQSAMNEMNYSDTIIFKNGREEKGEIIKYDDGNYRLQKESGGIYWYSCRLIKEVKSDDDWKVQKFKEYQKFEESVPKVEVNNQIVPKVEIEKPKEDDTKKEARNTKEEYSNRRAQKTSGGKIEATKQEPIKENHYDIGMSYYNSKKYNKAITEFNKDINEGITKREVYYFLGVSLFKTNKYSESISALLEALKVREYHDVIHYYLGENYYSLAEYSKAEYEWKLAMGMGNEDALKRIVGYYNRAGRVKEAIDLMENKYQLGIGLERDRLNELQCKFNEVNTSMNMRDFVSAKKRIDEAVGIAPNYFLTHYYLAYFHYTKDELQEAEKELGIACKLNPSFTRAYLLYAIIYAEEGDIYKALDKINEAKGIDPYDPLICYYSGEIYSMYEDTENAIKNYKGYLDSLGTAGPLDFFTRKSVEDKIKKLEE